MSYFFTSNNSNTFKIWISKQNINFVPTIKNNNNYEFHLSTLNLNEKYVIWHRRFAYFNIYLIKNKLMKKSLQPQCPICSNSKLKINHIGDFVLLFVIDCDILFVVIGIK